MKRFFRTLLPFGLAAVLGAATPLAQTQEFRGRSLDEWRALLEPSASELSYAEIPWHPSLWSALQEARELDRPILLWAMNGHPLGCT